MRDKKLKVGIIGLGHLHPRGYMALFEGCGKTQVVAACEQNGELREAFCAEFGLRGYRDLEAMLSHEDIQLAAIFLPHCDCAEAAVRCAAKGIHLMIEKPMTDTAAAAQRVAQAAQEHRVKITTGYCWRYHPVIQAMKQSIEEGLVGEVVAVEARLSAGKVERYIQGQAEWMLEKKKAGGGPMYNLGVHWIDILGYLLRDTITEVCAVNTRSSDRYDIEDNSVVMLKFGAGTVGVLSTSYIVPECFPHGRDLYLGIKGTRGVLRYSPGYEGEQGSGGAGQTEVLELYSDAEKVAGASGRKFSFQLDAVKGYSGYMGKAYVEDFVRAIMEDKEPSITVRDGIAVLKVVEAVYQSDRQKQWVGVQ